MASPSRSSPSSAAAPLYITVGPPCSGKTTWLRQNEITDVAIDDEPDVYVPLPWRLFVTEEEEKKKKKKPKDGDDDNDLLARTIVGKSVRERLALNEQDELKVVCACLSQKISTDTMGERLAAQSKKNAELAPDLVQAVGQLFVGTNDEGGMPTTVDLFCRDVLFSQTGDDDHPQNAIERALERLRSTPVDKPVAWGNTNLIGSDYKVALAMAHEQRRPVNFIVFDPSTQTCQLNPPSVSCDRKDEDACWNELLTRNLKRLLHSGRYIPLFVMEKMLENHVRCIQGQSRSHHHSSSSLSDYLVSRADFHYDPRTRQVRPDNKRPRGHDEPVHRSGGRARRGDNFPRGGRGPRSSWGQRGGGSGRLHRQHSNNVSGRGRGGRFYHSNDRGEERQQELSDHGYRGGRHYEGRHGRESGGRHYEGRHARGSGGRHYEGRHARGSGGRHGYRSAGRRPDGRGRRGWRGRPSEEW